MITKPIFTLMKVYGMDRDEARKCWTILHKKRLYETDKHYLMCCGIPYFADKRCGTLKKLDRYYNCLCEGYGKDWMRRMGKWIFPMIRFVNRIKLWN